METYVYSVARICFGEVHLYKSNDSVKASVVSARKVLAENEWNNDHSNIRGNFSLRFNHKQRTRETCQISHS